MTFPYIRTIICSLLAIPGALLATAGFSGIVDEISLRGSDTTVTGQATDWKTKSGQNWTRYSVRYAFQLPDHADQYTATDITGRKNLWARVTEEAWEQSKSSNAIEIVYLESDPWVNRPVATEGAKLADPATGALFGAGLACVPLYFVFTGIRAYLQHKRRIANGDSTERQLG